MKRALILIFLLSNFAYGQELPVNAESGRIVYTEVVDLPDYDAKLIYFSGLKFYKFRFIEEDIAIQDPDSYIIAGPMLTSFNYLGKEMFVFFNAELQFKDGRYRYEFLDFIVDTSGGGKIDLNKPWPKMMAGKNKITQLSAQSIEQLIIEMKSYIEKDLKKSDW